MLGLHHPGVPAKVIHRRLHRLAPQQCVQVLDQQLVLERVGMVLVDGLALLGRQLAAVTVVGVVV